MNLTTQLCLFMSVAAPTLAALRCFKCNDNCTKSSVNKSASGIEFTSTIEEASNRSVSPWEHIQDINNTRFPEIIWTANCKHDKCLNNSLQKFNHVLGVMAITYNIRVYYRESCQNKTHYRLVPGIFKVTVGCTCYKRKQEH
ncbi:hypothetical protein AAFF_G00109280 [Aldrovandia affinis]|uniref:Interleukin 17-like protein n=1 Tax=Aldrovandia affinis TaxID=143900 RepID=A0AAD7RTP2_9TELE|nr:hypothetical protein AAFF_G00109280 [Aldrovandia affinis]